MPLPLTASYTLNQDADFRRFFRRAINNQSIVLTGATAGTFRLVYRGSYKSGSLAYNASAAEMQNALNAVALIAAGGGVTVEGDPGDWRVLWNGDLALTKQPLLSYDALLLTGAGAIRIKVSRLARDLSGYTAKMQIRTSRDPEAELLIDLSDTENDDGQLILGGADGTIQLYIKRAKIDALGLADKAQLYGDLVLLDGGTPLNQTRFLDAVFSYKLGTVEEP